MKIVVSIILLAMVGLGMGVVFDQPILLLVACMATVLYSICFGIDVFRMIQQLQRVLGSRRLRRRAQEQPATILTSAGERLQPLVTGTLYQLTSLEDELLSSSLRQGSPSVVTNNTEEEVDDSCSLNQMLASLAREFRSVGIGVAVGGGLAGLKIESSGLSRERFVPTLTQYLSEYYRKSDDTCFGLFDSLSAGCHVQGFAAFGFRYVLCFPIVRKRENESAVVIIGFDEGSHPVPREVDKIRKRMNEFYRDFVSSEAMRELEKRAEQAEIQERAASQFIAHMSHDIRSPLSNIKSVVSILEDSYVGDDDDLFLIARKNCDSLEEMVEGVLDFNKSAAGQLTARRQSVDIGQLVLDVTKAFSIAGRQKTLQCSVSVSSDPCTIYADPHQVRRIITNLVSNAFKYTDFGSVTVSVKQNNDGRIELVIKDTGSGMSERQVVSMFDAFQRFDDSKQGVGLGLTVTKILTELNDGVISVQSELGRGTTVQIDFPFAGATSIPIVEAEDLPVAIVSEVPTAVEAAVRPRVLVVDDDEDSVFTLQRSLCMYELDVYVATSVEDAVAICNFGSPDVVITDDHMPGGGGARVVSFLSEHASTAHVFVLSGSTEAAIQDRYARFSSVAIFQKPTEVVSLVAEMAARLELEIPFKKKANLVAA